MEEARSIGLVATVARVFDTALATVQNRVELFSVELREEKCRIVEAMIMAGAVVASLGVLDDGIAAVRESGALRLLPAVLAGVSMVRRWRHGGKDGAGSGIGSRLMDLLLVALRKL